MKTIEDRLDDMIGELGEDEPRVSDKELIDLLEDSRNRIADLEARGRMYDEVLYQVCRATPGETRHESAVRIIHRHENQEVAPQESSKDAKI
jgi:hypothetical protein